MDLLLQNKRSHLLGAPGTAPLSFVQRGAGGAPPNLERETETSPARKRSARADDKMSVCFASTGIMVTKGFTRQGVVPVVLAK